MERQKLVISAVIFAAFAFGGFYMAFYASSSGNTKYVSGMNVTVDSGTDIATAEFDGHAIDLMHEDSKKARFYLDLDQDGSFDLELEDLVHDGTTQKYNRTVTLKNTNYRLYFRYQDDAEKEEDSWLTLYRVMEQ